MKKYGQPCLRGQACTYFLDPTDFLDLLSTLNKMKKPDLMEMEKRDAENHQLKKLQYSVNVFTSGCRGRAPIYSNLDFCLQLSYREIASFLKKFINKKILFLLPAYRSLGPVA
jgi:hypothetical protein